MANPNAVTPESLTRQVFVYVVMGSVAFLVGCALMMGLVPISG
jgi:hypothetical protein